MAYTDVARLAQHLGRTLTADQIIEAGRLITAAQAWIDGRTGTPWEQVAPVIERHTLSGPQVQLRQRPVLTVDGVTLRSLTLNAVPETLLPGSGYELIDPTLGVVLILPGYAGYGYGYGGAAAWLATITYTPNVVLDARIALAATQLVAYWLRPALEGIAGDIKSYSVGQELQVTFRDPADGSVRGIPDDVVALVDSARTPELVFA